MDINTDRQLLTQTQTQTLLPKPTDAHHSLLVLDLEVSNDPRNEENIGIGIALHVFSTQHTQRETREVARLQRYIHT